MIGALIEIGKERLRSILIATDALVFGMLPLATATGRSSESKNGLAWVIIGGLNRSLILTLILVSIAYVSVENFRTFIGKKRSRKVIQEKDAAAENP
jgi:hydrophobic/amphiphilic exporter-1 (mainly G- bacteria), HAE1 family